MAILQRKTVNLGDLTLLGNWKTIYSMLVELETIFETGLGVSIDQVILFILRHQWAPMQLQKCGA